MAAPMRCCLGRFSKTTVKLLPRYNNILVGLANKLEKSCRIYPTEVPTGRSISSLADEFKRAIEEKDTPSHKTSLCRTTEHNPENHTMHHEGLFYSVSEEDFQKWFSKGLHPRFYKQVKAFNENCLMIRQPCLEIFNCLNASDFSLPVIRYLLYGRLGAGKSSSLAHIMHFCGRKGWLVIHVPWASLYSKYIKELQVSSHNPDRVDCPVEAAEWLNYFRQTNEHLLTSLDLRVQNKYTWSKREACEVGTPWIDLVEYGLTRAKYSCDVMGAILKEAREHSAQGKLKTLVAIDAINALWDPTVYKRKDDGRYKYKPEDLSFFYSLRKMVNNNWSGGAVVGTVDTQGVAERRGQILPRSALENEALDNMDPHIPVQVPDYSEKEVHSCIQYYIDRKWIQRPEGLTEEGKKELIFLSCRNPLELYSITSRW